MKSTKEVFEHFKSFQIMLKREFGRTMDIFKTDGGSEYNHSEFETFLQLGRKEII